MFRSALMAEAPENRRTARRWILIALLALLAAAMVAVVAFKGTALTQARAGLGSPTSILGMLAERSPGMRAIGALVMTKQRPVTVAVATPPREPTAQRLIPRRAPPAAPAGDNPEGFTPPAAPPADLAGPEAAFTNPMIVPAGESAAAPDGPAPLLPPITGVSGLGPIPPSSYVPPVATPEQTLPPTGATPQTPAVPEPATWAMMLLGLLFCGAAMRQQRRRAATALA